MKDEIIYRYKNGHIIPIKVKKDITNNNYMNDKIRQQANNITHDEDIEQHIKRYTEELKNIKEFQTFKELENKMSQSGYGLVFRTKKGHWWAYGFTEENGNVTYLINDGISRRSSKLENLYKVIEISDRAR